MAKETTTGSDRRGNPVGARTDRLTQSDRRKGNRLVDDSQQGVVHAQGYRSGYMNEGKIIRRHDQNQGHSQTRGKNRRARHESPKHLKTWYVTINA